MLRLLLSLFVALFALSLQQAFGYEYKDGVYISTPSKKPSSSSVVVGQSQQERISSSSSAPQSRDQLVKQYIQEFIIQNVVNSTQDIMKRALSNNDLQIFPQIANLAIHQISLECFKQDVTKKILEDAFTEAFDKANKDFDDNLDQNRIKADIDSIIRSKVNPIKDNVVYKKIFEGVLRQAQQQQRKIIVMTMAQRQAQMAAVQQRYNAIRQALAKRYELFIQEMMKQRIEFYMKQRMQQQLQQQMQQKMQQQMQQQMQQKMQPRY